MDWLLAIAVLAAHAQTCTDGTTASRYVQDFKIDVASFGGLELCDSAGDSKKLLNDLELIERGEFAGTPKNLFIKEFIPMGAYYPWLAEQTHGIERGNDIPWATAYNSWGYFTLQDGWAKLSSLGRIGTIIHEARHTEGYSHTICDQGPYQGSSVSGCDSNLQAGGSHAIEMEYYARVHEVGVNFHPVFQSMARLMLLARANFVFNESPVAARELLLVRTSSGLLRIDQNEPVELPWEFAGSESFRLKKTSLGATLLDLPNGAWSIDLNKPDVSPGLTDEYSYYKILQSTPPDGLIDIEEVDIGIRRFLIAADDQGQAFSYVFGRGSWGPAAEIGEVDRLTTTSPLGKNSVFAIFSDQTFCELNPRTAQCLGDPQSWPDDAKKFVQFRSTTLRLGHDRKVYDSRESIYPPLDGLEVLDLTVVPDYGVFD